RVERPDGTLLRVLGPGDAYECAAAPCRPSATNADERSAANAAVVGNDVRGTAAGGAGASAVADESAVGRSHVAAGSGAEVASGQKPSAASRPHGSHPVGASSGIAEQLNRARLALAERNLEHARELIA